MKRIFLSALVVVFAAGTNAQNDLEFDLVLDRYGDETTWSLTGPSGVVGSGGPYTQQPANGAFPLPTMTFNNQPNGQYTFEILDSFGDGICCQYGNGSFMLSHVQTGITVVSGSSFTNSVNVPFTLPPSPPVVMASPLTVELVPFASGFTGAIDIAHAGDDRLFVVEQNGIIKIVNSLGIVNPISFLNIDPRVNSSGNEQGLLGLAFHPQYPDSGYFYVNYTATGGGNGGTTRVSRFSVTSNPDVADPNSEVILYTWPQPYTNHNGGDLEFGADGYLYVSFGDGGSGNDPQNHAQNLADPLGTIIRIDVDGDSLYSIPADNPFVNSPNELDEIWAYGLRNPWRIGFDALTGDLWIGDVGQNAWEEVDFWPAGDTTGPNFGWRCYEGLHNAVITGCGPLASYVGPASEHQQTAQGWCSVIGGRVYRGVDFPRLYGRYIYTDYCGGQFYSLLPNGSGGWVKEELQSQGYFGYAAIGENNLLEMFVANENDGQIYRIVDPCPDAAPVITQNGNELMSTQAISYTWFLNGNEIIGATSQTFTPMVSGSYFVIAQTSLGCFLQSDSLIIMVTGIQTLQRSTVSVHPVPARDQLKIMVKSPLPGGSYYMKDMAGRTVTTGTWPSQSTTLQLDVSGASPGTYIIQLVDEQGVPQGNARAVITR